MRNMIERYAVKRLTSREGATMFFMIYLGSRSRGHKTFSPEEVPPFEGDEATFEIDRAKGGWRFVRQV
jgi:hypothetical protein